MIQAKCRVVKMDKKNIYLMPLEDEEMQKSCGSCQANKSCGTSLLSKLFRRQNLITHPKNFENFNDSTAYIGAIFMVSISEKTLIYRAFLVYILPLIALFLSALFASILLPDSDISQTVFGIMGFGISFYFIKTYYKSQQFNITPAKNIKT